jgi:hypothetical protein
MNARWRVTSKFDVEKPPILALSQGHREPGKSQRNSLKTNERRRFYSTHKSTSFEAQNHGRR